MMNGQLKRLISLLEKIDERLMILDEKIERISERVNSGITVKTSEPRGSLDAETLLSLPNHLRRTAISICRLGEATAARIAKETGRSRAAESDYLNQLVARDYVGRKRIDRKVVFYVKK